MNRTKYRHGAQILYYRFAWQVTGFFKINITVVHVVVAALHLDANAVVRALVRVNIL